jgi:hypothetical protein
MVAGLILGVVAFMGPWYTMNGTGTLGVNYTVDMYLTRMEAKGTIFNNDISWSTGYAEAQENAQSVGVNTQSFTIIQTAMYLTFFALVTALLAILGMTAFVFRFGTARTMKYFGGVCGLVMSVLAVVPAVYVMTTGFSENNTGFWFKETVLGVTITGGPGYAWYLMIVVAIIAVISAAAILLTKVPRDDTVAPPM